MGKTSYFKASSSGKYLQAQQLTEKFEEIRKTRITYETAKKHRKSDKGITVANKNI